MYPKIIIMSWNKIESIIYTIMFWIGAIMCIFNFIMWTFIVDYDKIFMPDTINITTNQFHYLMAFLFLSLSGILTKGVVGSWKYWRNKLNYFF